jgi:hypothetical protein
MGNRRALALPFLAAALVLCLTGCTATVQTSGPLDVRLTRVGAPAGAFRAPPKGSGLLSCSIRVVNASASSATVDYQHAELLLYEGDREVGGGWEGMSYGAGTAGGRALEGSSTQLPRGASVSVHRTFLVEPGWHWFRAVYRLKGYSDFEWQVPWTQSN